MSRNLSCHWYLRKRNVEKYDKKVFSIPKRRWFLNSLRKRNATLCAILDMVALNTDIINTGTDDKNLNRCLIQLRRSDNLTGLSQKLSVEQQLDTTTHGKNKKFHICLLFSWVRIYVWRPTQPFRLSNTDSQNRFPFLKKTFHFKRFKCFRLKKF